MVGEGCLNLGMKIEGLFLIFKNVMEWIGNLWNDVVNVSWIFFMLFDLELICQFLQLYYLFCCVEIVGNDFDVGSLVVNLFICLLLFEFVLWGVQICYFNCSFLNMQSIILIIIVI